ncbi:MAG: hypothetical protein IK083_04810 [Abditibacteriota bacterium]|nr:hypothetical protein [Abditibacteriota bacterium]
MRYFILCVVTVLLPLSVMGFDAEKEKTTFPFASSYLGEVADIVPVPDYCSEYQDSRDVRDPDRRYQTVVYEYDDAIIIKKDFNRSFCADKCYLVKGNALTGNAGGHPWVPLHEGRFARDRIYSAEETANGVVVIAFLTDFEQSDSRYYELLTVDTILPDKCNGKTCILREKVPKDFWRSLNLMPRDISVPVPEKAALLTDNIIRLEYKNGAIEHWLVRLSDEDIRKNGEMYKGDNPGIKRAWKRRALIWRNSIDSNPRKLLDKDFITGEGSKGAENSAKSWNYNDDASREPVYEDQKVSVPETTASAKHMNVLSGLLARIGGFFRGLFGNA